ncbi:hypothetical protein RR46_10457 [Papilio xuthus]|uniref:Uncharacterized protein n=1 Tax=Papilio xuthus TaxID=66420 RepID=A0A194PIP9_PAPXU|nr:hypothetical protein RR46_10457 [Papilio xuthus]
MAGYTLQTIRKAQGHPCAVSSSRIPVQLSHGLYYETMSKTCIRRLPFKIKNVSTKEINVCPSKSLELQPRMISRNSPQY